MKQDLVLNKQNAIEFYRTAYLGDPAQVGETRNGNAMYQANRLHAGT